MIHGWYSLFASKSKAFKITETHVSHGNISCEIYTAKWFICPVIFVVIIMIFICLIRVNIKRLHHNGRNIRKEKFGKGMIWNIIFIFIIEKGNIE